LSLKVLRGRDGVAGLKTISNNPKNKGEKKRIYNPWTDEEKEYLKANYLLAEVSRKDLEATLNHSWSSIKDMAKKMRLCGRRDTEWRKKHSKSLIEGYRTGRIKSQTGIKKMSEEAREKLRKANTGINNPNFGRCRSERPSEHYHNGGYYYSEKNKKQIYYRSMYELMAYRRLEEIQEVTSYEIEPFSIRYIRNEGYEGNYTPDILVHYSNGHKKVIEVKPARLLQLWNNPAKLKALSEYVNEQNNMSFEIWTEREIGIKC
jgi:hypothetical protein